jgi:hypothetical protein
MSMDISGLKDALTVRCSHHSFFSFDLTIFYFRADVINVSGHRLSTAEIESALIMHKGVAETAGTFLLMIAYRILDSHDFLLLAIGTSDDLTGQAVYAFVTLKP